jgi:stress response protein SCP2
LEKPVVLTFQAGQNFSLSQQTPGIQQVDLGLSWEPADGPWTLDASAFALTVQGQVRNDGDFIFYNQPVLAGGGVQLAQEGRRFIVRLNDLPADIARVAIASPGMRKAAKRSPPYARCGWNCATATVRPASPVSHWTRPA